MNVPFIDFTRQYAAMGKEVEHAAHGVLARGFYILGDEVLQFEKEFAAYCGAKEAVGVASGTDALRLALTAAGIGKGDEVITAGNSAAQTAIAIMEAGATPVFSEIGEDYNLEQAHIAEKITPKTKAIMPVHLYGQMADMAPILEIGEKKGLVVIEDAAQAHGAAYKGKKAGSMGQFGCFSFYPTKNLGAYGDGGMIMTNDREAAAQLRLMRNSGNAGEYNHVIRGITSRLDELQAAMLRAKLRHLDEWREVRRKKAAQYCELLQKVATPKEMPGRKHAYHLFAIRTEQQQKLRAHLAKKNIATLIHYPHPIYQQQPFRQYMRGSLPETERHAREELSLPLYPELREEELTYVADAINRFL